MLLHRTAISASRSMCSGLDSEWRVVRLRPIEQFTDYASHFLSMPASHTVGISALARKYHDPVETSTALTSTMVITSSSLGMIHVFSCLTSATSHCGSNAAMSTLPSVLIVKLYLHLLYLHADGTCVLHLCVAPLPCLHNFCFPFYYFFILTL